MRKKSPAIRHAHGSHSACGRTGKQAPTFDETHSVGFCSPRPPINSKSDSGVLTNLWPEVRLLGNGFGQSSDFDRVAEWLGIRPIRLGQIQGSDPKTPRFRGCVASCFSAGRWSGRCVRDASFSTQNEQAIVQVEVLPLLRIGNRSKCLRDEELNTGVGLSLLCSNSVSRFFLRSGEGREARPGPPYSLG